MRRLFLIALAAIVVPACGSGGSGTTQPTAVSPPPPPPLTEGKVPGHLTTVYLATALACSKLDTEDAQFTPADVVGKGFHATIGTVRDCREESVFNSYVYRVPTPKTGRIGLKPGDQPGVTLDAAKLTASGAATVYYAREGSGKYKVTVIDYRKTGDVTAWSG